MKKKYLPKRRDDNNHLIASRTSFNPPNIFNRNSHLKKSVSGDRVLASRITRTAIYKDAKGNMAILKEDETSFSAPKDLRGAIVTSPNTKIKRR